MSNEVPRSAEDDVDIFEMKKAAEKYREFLDEIRYRLDFGMETLMQTKEAPPHNALMLETAALQLRKILELIGLSGFLTNEDKVRQVKGSFHSQRAVGAVVTIKKAHPDWWPKAVDYDMRYTHLNQRRTVKDMLPGMALQEDEWSSAYHLCCEVVHVSNPFVTPRDSSQDAAAVEEYFLKVSRLLGYHFVFMTGYPDYALYSEISPDAVDTSLVKKDRSQISFSDKWDFIR